MFGRKADAPLLVQVPTAGQDRPSWMKVGVIAAIGFLVGVAWPRLAGVRLGPAVPEAASPSALATAPTTEPASSAVTSAALPAVVASPAAAPPPPVAAAPPPVTGPAPATAPPSATAAPMSASATVAHGYVFACIGADGEALKGSACGSLPALDSLVMPRLRKLADCPEAAAANGKLHLVARLDFSRNALGVELGRTRGVSPAEPLLACAKAALAGTSVNGIAHEKVRYSVAYSVTFGSAASPAGATQAPRGGDEATAEGAAQVVWEVAIVRDIPKTGKIVARLQRGAAVRVGPVKDGWYPIKYGDGFASDGWVYRGAIGK
jgi:hypothetical protein